MRKESPDNTMTAAFEKAGEAKATRAEERSGIDFGSDADLEARRLAAIKRKELAEELVRRLRQENIALAIIASIEKDGLLSDTEVGQKTACQKKKREVEALVADEDKAFQEYFNFLLFCMNIPDTSLTEIAASNLIKELIRMGHYRLATAQEAEKYAGEGNRNQAFYLYFQGECYAPVLNHDDGSGHKIMSPQTESVGVEARNYFMAMDEVELTEVRRRVEEIRQKGDSDILPLNTDRRDKQPVEGQYVITVLPRKSGGPEGVILLRLEKLGDKNIHVLKVLEVAGLGLSFKVLEEGKKKFVYFSLYTEYARQVSRLERPTEADKDKILGSIVYPKTDKVEIDRRFVKTLFQFLYLAINRASFEARKIAREERRKAEEGAVKPE